MLILVVSALAGCRGANAPATNMQQRDTMPPNTVLLSTMMNDLSEQPGFTDKIIAAMTKQSKTGAALLSPALLHAMRVAILGKDWHGLDHFPGWKIRDIDPVVDVAGEVAGEVDKSPEGVARPLTTYIDLGDYTLDHARTVDMDKPSALPGFSAEGLVKPLGDGVVRGDDANPEIAPMHSESVRLAEVLNRLSLNPPQKTADGVARFQALLDGHIVASPADLVSALIASGHIIDVVDARYFANFGHLHYQGKDVMMPFWVNTQVVVPGTRRPLLVPVAHAEYEWLIRGPRINADVSFYFGIDGKAEFRTMDTLDQAWVMGRYAHEYRGADAVEVTRLTGLAVLAYAHAHLAHPRLPFGGYYALGVCQDSIGAIEQKMTGKTTLFPNTADMALFNDPRDSEINALLAAIPKDRSGGPPHLERIFGSLPTTDIAAITIPGLAADLESVRAAWQNERLGQAPRPVWRIVLISVFGIATVLLIALLALRLSSSPGVEPR